MKKLLSLAVLLVACSMDPLEEYHAVPFNPRNGFEGYDTTHYPEWWVKMERCSGLRGDYQAVSWYTVAEKMDVKGRIADGYWVKDGNEILIWTPSLAVEALIEHEMLHALIHHGGHPAVFDTCHVRNGSPRN